MIKKANKTPKLLLYGTTWRFPRNALFAHYLANWFDVYVIMSSSLDSNIEKLAYPAKFIRHRFIKMKSIGLSFSVSFQNIVKQIRPDYIVTVEPHTLATFQSLLHSRGHGSASVVFTWQNLESIPKYFLQKLLLRYTKEHSDCLLAGTTDAKNYLINKRFNKQSIFVLPETGYDNRLFRPDGENFRKKWGLGGLDIVILFAGRLSKEKGVSDILKVAEMQLKNENVYFIFAGGGPLVNEVSECRLRNVKYVGRYEYCDMPKVMRSCDIAVCPSVRQKYWMEQFGYSVVEANACGKPVVASMSGSLNYLIKEGINGGLFSEKDTMAFNNKLEIWIEKISRGLSLDSVVSAVNKFDNNNIAKAYFEILTGNNLDNYRENWY
jgi:glycosyltransferase involved in cell wall biosynthesis